MATRADTTTSSSTSSSSSTTTTSSPSARAAPRQGQCVSRCPDRFYSSRCETAGAGRSHVCKPCDSSCLTCTSASPTSCTSCTSGLLRYDGQCLKSCSEIQTPVYQVPQDQDDNEHDGSCHDCHPSCGSCNTGSASSCTTCPSTSFAEKVGLRCFEL
jgi:proprotein convertase subtilisin/kexin type 5